MSNCLKTHAFKQERHLDTKETLLSFRCEILYFNDKGQECRFSIRNLVDTRLGNERESKKPLLTRVVNDYLRYILNFNISKLNKSPQ